MNFIVYLFQLPAGGCCSTQYSGETV